MKKVSISSLFWAFVNIVSMGLILGTLFGFLGSWWWVFDLASHFRVQYALGLLGVLVVFLLGKRLRSGSIIASGVLLNAVFILPLLFPSPAVLGGNVSYGVVLANVNLFNDQHHLIRAWIEETDPDFVALLEVNQNWLDTLNLEAEGYPYMELLARDDHFGIAFYSRIPIERSEVKNFGGVDLPAVIAQVMVDGDLVTFIVAHPVPPTSGRSFQYRNLQMQSISRFVAELDHSVIIAGDLNATSWSPNFTVWQTISGLKDSRQGFGIQSTWPTMNWLLSIPIDHFLISDNVLVHHREVGPDIGSDHYPILMDFSISDKTGEN